MFWKFVQLAVFFAIVYWLVDAGAAEGTSTGGVALLAMVFTALIFAPFLHLEMWLRRRRLRREGCPEDVLPRIEVADSPLTVFVRKRRAERLAGNARKRLPK